MQTKRSAPTIRQINAEDLPSILDFRHRMMNESGTVDWLREDWRTITAKIYTGMYEDGTGVHFGAVVGTDIVATAGAMVKNDFPFMTFQTNRYGWVMDVYVLPEFRKQGLAKQLTLRTVEWLREHDVSIIRLLASRQASETGMYHRLGFVETGEMVLRS